MKTKLIRLGWEEVYGRVFTSADAWARKEIKSIWGMPRGGAIVAGLIGAMHGWIRVVESPRKADLLIEDVIDTGTVASELQRTYGKPIWALVDLRHPPYDQETWIHLPWETEDEIPATFKIGGNLTNGAQDPYGEADDEEGSAEPHGWEG